MPSLLSRFPQNRCSFFCLGPTPVHQKKINYCLSIFFKTCSALWVIWLMAGFYLSSVKFPSFSVLYNKLIWSPFGFFDLHRCYRLRTSVFVNWFLEIGILRYSSLKITITRGGHSKDPSLKIDRGRHHKRPNYKIVKSKNNP